MKLKGINRDDMAAIAVAVNEYDDTGGLEYVVEQIGQKLGIEVVAGEGYDTTVWRVCKLILGQEDAPTASERISEMLYNVGVNNANIHGSVSAGLFKDVLDMLNTEGANRDYEMGRESVQTIINQHVQYGKSSDDN